MNHDDEMLLHECLSGNHDAFGFLIDRYKTAVYGLARHKLGNHEDAEDVTQEAFLKAYQNLRTFKPPYNFSSWLYTITANCCRDWLRRRVRTAEREVPLEETALETLEQHALEIYQADELRSMVREAIAGLAESDQQVVTLYYMHGLTCKEIGRFLGTSARAIEMRLYRARQQLKKEILTMIQTEGSLRQLIPFCILSEDIVMNLTLRRFETFARLNPLIENYKWYQWQLYTQSPRHHSEDAYNTSPNRYETPLADALLSIARWARACLLDWPWHRYK